MQLKRNKSKVTLFGAVLVCVFFVNLPAVNARTISAPPTSRSSQSQEGASNQSVTNQGKSSDQKFINPNNDPLGGHGINSNAQTNNSVTQPKSWWSKFKSFVGDVYSQIKSAASGVASGIKYLGSKIADFYNARSPHWLKSIVSFGVRGVSKIVKTVKHGIYVGAQAVKEHVIEKINKAVTKLSHTSTLMAGVVYKVGKQIYTVYQGTPELGTAFGIFSICLLAFMMSKGIREKIATALTDPNNNLGEFIDKQIPDSWKRKRGIMQTLAGFGIGLTISLAVLGPTLVAGLLTPEQSLQNIGEVAASAGNYTVNRIEHPSLFKSDLHVVTNATSAFIDQNPYDSAKSIGKITGNVEIAVAGSGFGSSAAVTESVTADTLETGKLTTVIEDTNVAERSAGFNKTDLGKIWNDQDRYGSSAKSSYQHWLKHGDDFEELQNAKQYVESAHNFANNPPAGTLYRTLENGREAFYDPSTNTMVLLKDGVPASFYKPDILIHGNPTNLDYFNILK